MEKNHISGHEHLRNTGDYFETIMGWLKGTPAGGGTQFFKFNTEVSIWPTKGSGQQHSGSVFSLIEYEIHHAIREIAQ